MQEKKEKDTTDLQRRSLLKNTAAETWVRERLGEILRGRSHLVAAGMRRRARLRGLAPKERAGVDKCAHYLG